MSDVALGLTNAAQMLEEARRQLTRAAELVEQGSHVDRPGEAGLRIALGHALAQLATAETLRWGSVNVDTASRY